MHQKWSITCLRRSFSRPPRRKAWTFLSFRQTMGRRLMTLQHRSNPQLGQSQPPADRKPLKQRSQSSKARC
jgi:hypothetical protein